MCFHWRSLMGIICWYYVPNFRPLWPFSLEKYLTSGLCKFLEPCDLSSCHYQTLLYTCTWWYTPNISLFCSTVLKKKNFEYLSLFFVKKIWRPRSRDYMRFHSWSLVGSICWYYVPNFRPLWPFSLEKQLTPNLCKFHEPRDLSSCHEQIWLYSCGTWCTPSFSLFCPAVPEEMIFEYLLLFSAKKNGGQSHVTAKNLK